MADNSIYTCGSREPGQHDVPLDFLPLYIGSLAPNTQIIKSSGTCFNKVTFSYTVNQVENGLNDLVVNVETEDAQSLLCKDWFFFGNTEMYHVETFFFSGNHQITFKALSKDSVIDLQHNGL